MAALSRLQQRIAENFHETTRDLGLLTGSSTSTATYFDTSDDKLKEISKLLESRSDRERLDGMKRIIAGISKGRDMEGFFAQVVKNVVAPSIEIRKLVYIYLLRFASTNSDLLLLSINTFQKDLSDQSPLIRSMSLRVLTSIRVPVIQGIVMLGLKKLVNDRNPWVRKTVAGGLAKVYEMDASSLSQIIPLLQTLLASQSPLTLGATLTAFTEICPDRLDLLHPYYRHICRLIVDADEWGQVVALDILTRYARTMLDKPMEQPTGAANGQRANGNESEDEFEGIDIDLAMLLDCARPLFQSRNPAVLLAICTTYFHLAPLDHPSIGQQLLVAPLLRLAGAPRDGEEVTALAWDVVSAMIDARPALFASRYAKMFAHSTDTSAVKVAKIRALTLLVSKENVQSMMREFKHYTRDSEEAVAENAVRAIGHCVRTQSEVALAGLSTLMRLLKSPREGLVAQAVIVLKSVILALPSSALSTTTSLPDPQRLVARLAKGLDGVTNAQARASVYWLIGQYAVTEDNKGLGWDGIASWVPDVLRKGVKGFKDEPTIAKLQILTLTAKLQTVCPANSQLALLAQYLFMLARYDLDYDVRDRGRFLYALLRGVRDEKRAISGQDATDDEDEEEDQGGVVLRREQVGVVLLGKREAADEQASRPGAELQVGSLSRITGKRLMGYEPIPEWTDDPTDASLRESEAPRIEQSRPSVASTPRTSTPNITVAAPPAALPVHVSASAASLSRSIASSTTSPAGSVPAPHTVKGKFQDLDKFLDSESETEEETEEESDDSAEMAPRPVTAPPRSAIVPEYDEDASEDEDEDEADEETDSEEEPEQAPLYGQYR